MSYILINNMLDKRKGKEMKIERLELSSKKVKIAFIAGIVLTAVLFIMVNYLVTKAKYRNTESLDLVKGTISYNKADLNIIAMYQEKDDYISEDDKYTNINKIPTSGYKLSNKSYCEVNGEPIEEVETEYKNNAIYVGNITEKGTKCYIYFDSLAREMLSKLEASKESKYIIDAMPNPITGPYDEQKENPEGKEKLYTSPDNYGTSYVFRGNNDDVNNWVSFADHTWRIIRINGDGTLRMIYQCATPNCETTEGEETNALTSAYKSEPYNDNTYVGYYYGEAGQETYETTHTNTTPSTIAETVNNWYNETGNMASYTKFLSGSTGFCNDRVVVKNVFDGYESDGSGQTATSYAPASRLMNKGGWRAKQYPTLKCGVAMPEENPSNDIGFSSFDEIDATALKRDLFTTQGSGNGNEVLTNPVGLITSDEVVMTGGFGGVSSTDYWLYTSQNYWTMSPYVYDITNKRVSVFRVREDGYLGTSAVRTSGIGVRPVINLKSDITFSGGNGTSSKPFIVNTGN